MREPAFYENRGFIIPDRITELYRDRNTATYELITGYINDLANSPRGRMRPLEDMEHETKMVLVEAVREIVRGTNLHLVTKKESELAAASPSQVTKVDSPKSKERK